jgi:hypothetical protein
MMWVAETLGGGVIILRWILEEYVEMYDLV